MANNTKKAVYPEGLLISKKAYRNFAERLNETLSVNFNNPTAANQAMALLDKYATGQEPVATGCDVMAQVAFMMIQPEIDKAIARSKGARERAAARKERKQNAISNNDTQENKPRPASPSEIFPSSGERIIDSYEVEGIPVRIIESPEMNLEAYNAFSEMGIITKDGYFSTSPAGAAASASTDA